MRSTGSCRARSPRTSATSHCGRTSSRRPARPATALTTMPIPSTRRTGGEMPSWFRCAVLLIRGRFLEAGVELDDVQVRRYPEEAAFIVLVADRDLRRSAGIGNELDTTFLQGGLPAFVAVRTATRAVARSNGPLRKGVQDDRACADVRSSTLFGLYCERGGEYLDCNCTRHQLIFGRRGAGKTALLVEAKRRVEEEGDLAVWINVQTYRRESFARVFLWTAKRIIDLISTNAGKSIGISENATGIGRDIDTKLGLCAWQHRLERDG